MCFLEQKKWQKFVDAKEKKSFSLQIGEKKEKDNNMRHFLLIQLQDIV